MENVWSSGGVSGDFCGGGTNFMFMLLHMYIVMEVLRGGGENI